MEEALPLQLHEGVGVIVGVEVGEAGGGLRFPPGPILVVGVVGHVLGSDPLGLVYEGPLLRLREQLPLGAQALRYLRVVHLRVVLGDLPPLHPRPHHERVHRPLDVLAFAGFRLLLLV